MCEIKNILSGINSWFDIVEEKISESEVMAIEIIHKGTHRLKKKIQLQQIHQQNLSERGNPSGSLVYM